MKKNLEKENRHLLWLLMEFCIARYILSNTHGRLDGYEKAMRHRELCSIFIASKLFCSIEKAPSKKEYQHIHDYTQKLTNYLDREIGLPLDDAEYDLNDLSKKFFDKFIKLAESKWNQLIRG